jgi:hypothetical protein
MPACPPVDRERAAGAMAPSGALSGLLVECRGGYQCCSLRLLLLRLLLRQAAAAAAALDFRLDVRVEYSSVTTVLPWQVRPQPRPHTVPHCGYIMLDDRK